jgi:hypothetical protein
LPNVLASCGLLWQHLYESLSFQIARDFHINPTNRKLSDTLL